jgi:glycosyltransferase involved in cell wall biosynthesis
MKPFLSIAITAYNDGKYIAKTLDSVLEQEHNYVYEIIIGDDCSTDDTQVILLDYQKKYPDIITLIFNERNIGLVKNLFNVLSHCTGTYLLFVGGDDYWLPGRIALQIPFMEEHPEYGLCYGKAQILQNEKIQKNKCWGIDLGTEDILSIGKNIPFQTVCMKNNLIQEYIVTIHPELREWKSDDYPMSVYFFYKTKCYFMNSFLAVYRVHPHSISHKRDKKTTISFIESDYNAALFFREYFNVAIDSLVIEKRIILKRLNAALRYGDRQLAAQCVCDMDLKGLKGDIKYLIKRICVGNPLFFKVLYLYGRLRSEVR